MAGVLLLDKPAGPSSHDLVAAARRRFGEKAGHAGTLDPFATGLLIVLLGREATRHQSLFMSLDKAYRTRARLGQRSTTGDPTGQISSGRDPRPLRLPTGSIDQVPPVYSAIKIGGRRAYSLAREGAEPTMPPRRVEVARFDCTDQQGDEAEFEIECSSGTYVRSLIADLGDAYCLELRRTRIGPFDVSEADPDEPIGLDTALDRAERHRRDAELAARDAERRRRLARRRGAGDAKVRDR